MSEQDEISMEKHMEEVASEHSGAEAIQDSDKGAEVPLDTVIKKKRNLFPVIISAIVAVLALAAVVGLSYYLNVTSSAARARAQVKAGFRHLDDYNYEKAVAAFERAIKIDPKNDEAYLGLAETYVDMGEYEKAAEALKRGKKATNSNVIDDYYTEINDEWMEIIRGFEGQVCVVDTDLDVNNNPPLENAHVKVRGKQEREADTDSEGNFEMPSLPNGEYQLVFSAAGYQDYSTVATIEDERINLSVVLEPEEYADLFGSVMIADEDMDYSNNMPLAGAEVKLEKLTGLKPYEGTAHTDENGQYEFEGLVMGVYQLSIQEEGYQPVIQNVIVYEGQAICYNVMIEIIGDKWQGKGTASGKIYDAVTGYGVKDLTLKIRKGINQLDGPVVETLKTSDDGTYITPELDSGNYTVELADESREREEHYLGSVISIKILGGMNISNQDGTVSTTMTTGQVRIVMSWGEKPNDLDSHFWCMLDSGDNGHIWYQDKTFYGMDGERIADLDLDDTDCYGPETTTIYTPKDGIYNFGVFNYSHNNANELKESKASVQVYMGNNVLPNYVFYVPTDEGYYWDVFSYDTKSQRLTPVNQIVDGYSALSYSLNFDYSEERY